MTTDLLKKKLMALHSQLQAINHLDPDMRRLLEALDRDIHTLVDKTGMPSPASDWADTLRAQAARFAAQHPHIEASLREIAETLARMGI